MYVDKFYRPKPHPIGLTALLSIGKLNMRDLEQRSLRKNTAIVDKKIPWKIFPGDLNEKGWLAWITALLGKQHCSTRAFHSPRSL